MDRSAFEKQFCKKLEDEIPGVTFRMDKISKIQKSYDGIIAQTNESAVGICLDLDNVYMDYLNNGDFDAVVERAVCTAKTALAEAPDVSFITDYEKVKEKLITEVVSTERNREKLNDTVHREFLDLSLVVRIQMDKGSATVSKAMLSLWDVTEEQILQDAVVNSIAKKPVVITGFLNWLMKDEETSSMDRSMMIAGTREGTFGASVICYPDFIEKATEISEGGFYILPSSIHEVLIVPDEYSEKKSGELRTLVHEVNETQVAYEDQLSDSVYYCDGKEIRVA